MDTALRSPDAACQLKSRRSGGIGRRASLRGWCPQGRGGSSPPSDTRCCTRIRRHTDDLFVVVIVTRTPSSAYTSAFSFGSAVPSTAGMSRRSPTRRRICSLVSLCLVQLFPARARPAGVPPGPRPSTRPHRDTLASEYTTVASAPASPRLRSRRSHVVTPRPDGQLASASGPFLPPIGWVFLSNVYTAESVSDAAAPGIAKQPPTSLLGGPRHLTRSSPRGTPIQNPGDCRARIRFPSWVRSRNPHLHYPMGAAPKQRTLNSRADPAEKTKRPRSDTPGRGRLAGWRRCRGKAVTLAGGQVQLARCGWTWRYPQRASPHCYTRDAATWHAIQNLRSAVRYTKRPRSD